MYLPRHTAYGAVPWTRIRRNCRSARGRISLRPRCTRTRRTSRPSRRPPVSRTCPRSISSTTGRWWFGWRTRWRLSSSWRARGVWITRTPCRRTRRSRTTVSAGSGCSSCPWWCTRQTTRRKRIALRPWYTSVPIDTHAEM